MAKKRWILREPEPSEGGMIAFRRQLLFVLAVIVLYGSWLLILWMGEEGLTVRRLALVAWGSLLGVALLFLREGWPRTSTYLYLVGSLALTGLFAHALAQPLLLVLYILPMLAASLILPALPSLGVTIAATALMIRLTPPPQQSVWAGLWIVLASAVWVIGITARRTLALADYWERELALRQEALVSQLRERQGELNRTLKALDEAYVSLKRTNEELVLARQQAEEARALKEQFVANVSHELRTPLNLIVGFAEMMYLSPEIYGDVHWTPTLEGDIQEIYRASRHLQSLVNDILDLARIDASRLPMFRELQDLRTIVAEAVETIAPLFKQRGLDYHVSWPDELPQVFVDRTRIRQVLLNLLNNAVRFTDKGGITVRIEETKEAVMVSVQDTGTGIPADQLDKIFEEFRQVEAGPRSRGGAGLGLALSRQFVELHGGRMWVESTVGVGSTFYFSLPKPGALEQTIPLQRIPPKRKLEGTGAPVVLVDPDPSIADMLARYLGDRPVLALPHPTHIEEVVEAKHPLAVIINQAPDTPAEAWTAVPGAACARYNVPLLRCSIPSPSWLRQSSGLDDVLSKPISVEALRQLLQRQDPPPRSVLVVDDDPGFVRLMRRMLDTLEEPLQVWAAYNGAQALRLAHEAKPDLILLDLLMPEMDGFAVATALRQDPATQSLRIVAVTATSYAEEALQRRGSHLTLTQAEGLSTGTVVELLSAILKIVRPNYVAEETRPSKT